MSLHSHVLSVVCVHLAPALGPGWIPLPQRNLLEPFGLLGFALNSGRTFFAPALGPGWVPLPQRNLLEPFGLLGFALNSGRTFFAPLPSALILLAVSLTVGLAIQGLRVAGLCVGVTGGDS